MPVGERNVGRFSVVDNNKPRVPPDQEAMLPIDADVDGPEDDHVKNVVTFGAIDTNERTRLCTSNPDIVISDGDTSYATYHGESPEGDSQLNLQLPRRRDTISTSNPAVLDTIDEDKTALQSSSRFCRHGSLMRWQPSSKQNGTSSPGGRRFSEDLLTQKRNGMRQFGTTLYRSFKFKRVYNRLMQKSGDCNVSNENVPEQKLHYLRDIFTTLIDVKWRWSILLFVTSFVTSWTLFAVITYLICLIHGDLAHFGEQDWQPCVTQVNSFVSAFLYSVESQHTIGYGYRYITGECPEAVISLCIQAICGVMIQSFMAGVVFAKIARPKKRAQTIIFSKQAVVCMRGGKLCLLFRIGDMRTTHLVEAHVRMQLIGKLITKEGELLPFHQFDMSVGYSEGLDRILLLWPLLICHEIDENSPLYGYSKKDLPGARFEIVAILEGNVASTGMTTQARTSYLPTEILWGHRFEKLVTYKRDNGQYRVDYAKFHNTYPINTPTCSAKELDELKTSGVDPAERYPAGSPSEEDESSCYTIDVQDSPEKLHIKDLFSKDGLRKVSAPYYADGVMALNHVDDKEKQRKIYPKIPTRPNPQITVQVPSSPSLVEQA